MNHKEEKQKYWWSAIDDVIFKMKNNYWPKIFQKAWWDWFVFIFHKEEPKIKRRGKVFQKYKWKYEMTGL
jgi:hypothetical protein